MKSDNYKTQVFYNISKSLLTVGMIESMLETIPKKWINTQWEGDKSIIADNMFENLFIYGEVGTGKTLLARKLQIEYIQSGYNAVFVTMPDFLNLIIEFMKHPEDLIDPYTKYAEQKCVVILDDIGASVKDTREIELLTRLINYRYEEELPIIITSNLSVKDLNNHFGARIASRIIEMCKIIPIKGQDKRLLKHIETNRTASKTA